MQVGIGFSAQSDYIKAAKEAAEKAKFGISGNKTDLALLFNTAKFDHPLTLKTVSEFLGDIPLLGLSTPAVISSQGSSNHGIIIILFSFPEEIYFNTTCIKEIPMNGALEAGEKLGEDLLYGCKGVRRNLSIIFSDGNIPNGQNIAFGLQKRVGQSFPMVGASTYNQGASQEKASIYFGNTTLDNAACGILLGGRLNFGLGIKHGWQPLGKPRKVTLSAGNVIKEIDGKAAVSFYEEYFAKDANALKKELKRISTFYPLGIDIAGKKEYLLRSLSSIQNDGSLVFNGEIPQDSKVKLMVSSKEACLESTRQAAELAKKSLGNQKAKLVLIFNSWARSTLLGRQENSAIEIIKNVFGDETPLAGAYTSAEQAPLSSANYLGRPYFHNNSIVILAIAN